MSRPARSLPLLVLLAVLAAAGQSAAAHTRAAAQARDPHPRTLDRHSTRALNHHSARPVRVCWTSRRARGKHRLVCHLRLRAAHGTHSRGAGRTHEHTHGVSHKQARGASRGQVRGGVPKAPSSSAGVSTRAASDSAQVRAAVIANVLATPCQGAELTPAADNLEQIRAATFCLVNQERARHDETPLRFDARLERAAQGHSEDMLTSDYFDHVSPTGQTPLARIQATGYLSDPEAGYTVGENIAWGTLSLATPNAIVNAWIASPEHLANILDAQYRDSAVGVAPAAPPSMAQGQPGAIYSQEFGAILP